MKFYPIGKRASLMHFLGFEKIVLLRFIGFAVSKFMGEENEQKMFDRKTIDPTRFTKNRIFSSSKHEIRHWSFQQLFANKTLSP